MANNTLKVRHKQRYDTEANWKSKDPILLAGEMAISSDKNGRFKVGDGKNKWSVLAYSKADLSKSDVTTALGYTPPTTNTTYSTGTASTAGIGKLYTTTGTATDGSMTQSAITTALNGKSATTHTHNYAGSSSAGGVANSALKLATARTINGVSFNGTDNITLTANPTANQLSNQDLNTTTTPAFYYAAGSNSVTNKPSGVDAFGMIVMKNASGYTEQLLIDINQKFLMRVYNGSSWTAWASVYTTLNKPSKSDVGLGNVENKSSATIRGELTKDNITTALGYTPPTTNTTYVTGTTSTAGITKLYTSTGTGTDGAMTQAATTTALNGKANSSHTHSYAGSSSAGGSATSAVKLDTTTAGSATQPVYFTGGKPKTCTYTLGCSVPSGAKFTDTNTWRGIQNNLTSDSTTDSLSAAQGKALKALVDGKAASSHSHNYAGASSAGGAATNALALNGIALANKSAVFGKVPYIGTDGVIELGRYIDFHYNNSEDKDYTTRITPVDGNGALNIIPARSSTEILRLSSNGQTSVLGFYGSIGAEGFLGFNNTNKLVRIDATFKKEYRIHDTGSITYGTAAPTAAATAGDIYIQIT